jgi:isoleucyl-tRNA synthetase
MNNAGIKIRTPLKKMFIKNENHKDIRWIKDNEFSSLVREELNVKDIEAIDDTGEFISYSVKPDYSILGTKLGGGVKEVARNLDNLDPSQTDALIESGEITITIDGKEKTIEKEEVKITRECVEGFESEVEGSLTVIMDIRLTTDLLREGMARDLVNRIQNFRKESGLEVSDRIELSYRADGEIERVFQEYGDYIGSETLSENIVKGRRDWNNNTTFELDGLKVEIWLRRV